MQHTASYLAETASVSSARLWLRTLLDDRLPEEQALAAELCLSELAANAVRHARTEFDVEVSDGDGGVRIAVSDHNFRPVRARFATPTDVTGRGLQIVEAVASQWGVDQTADGKTVWCTIDS